MLTCGVWGVCAGAIQPGADGGVPGAQGLLRQHLLLDRPGGDGVDAAGHNDADGPGVPPE